MAYYQELTPATRDQVDKILADPDRHNGDMETIDDWINRHNYDLSNRDWIRQATYDWDD